MKRERAQKLGKTSLETLRLLLVQKVSEISGLVWNKVDQHCLIHVGKK